MRTLMLVTLGGGGSLVSVLSLAVASFSYPARKILRL